MHFVSTLTVAGHPVVVPAFARGKRRFLPWYSELGSRYRFDGRKGSRETRRDAGRCKKSTPLDLWNPTRPTRNLHPLMCAKTRVKGERLKLDEAATTAFAEGYCTRQRCLHRLHSVQSSCHARLDMARKVRIDLGTRHAEFQEADPHNNSSQALDTSSEG